jgi:hypothetical protein
MKRIVFAVLIAVIAASPAAAAMKKSKKMKPAPIALTNSNENSARFARDSLPILPSWSIPLYLQVKGQ